jgi:hypothetical protein
MILAVLIMVSLMIPVVILSYVNQKRVIDNQLVILRAVHRLEKRQNELTEVYVSYETAIREAMEQERTRFEFDEGRE